jgi:tetratricopeptide (TPR) repeat protein
MQLGKFDSENSVQTVWNKFNLFKFISALPRPVLLGSLFIILATLAAYWPVFSAGFTWDDDAYVTQNKLLTEADGWWHIWFSAHFQSQYFPLVYQYLACLGLIALFAAMVSRLSEKWRINYLMRCALVFLLLLTLGALTWKQADIYQNLEVLWHDTLDKNPNSWMAHANLGRLLTSQEKFSEAETHYREALRIKPDNEDIQYNYGNMLVKSGRIDEVIAQYERALQLAPDDPDVHNNLGIALYQKHQMDEAIAHFREAIRYRPDYTNAHYNLGNALFVEHKFDEAIEEYKEALHLEPDSEQIINRLRALGVQTN